MYGRTPRRLQRGVAPGNARLVKGAFQERYDDGRRPRGGPPPSDGWWRRAIGAHRCGSGDDRGVVVELVLDPILEDGLTSDQGDGSYERVPPWERTQFEWNTTEGHGFVQEEGPYGLLEGESE